LRCAPVAHPSSSLIREREERKEERREGRIDDC
jgi:hypothetical protein